MVVVPTSQCGSAVQFDLKQREGVADRLLNLCSAVLLCGCCHWCVHIKGCVCVCVCVCACMCVCVRACVHAHTSHVGQTSFLVRS